MFHMLFQGMIRICPSLQNPRQPLYVQRLAMGSSLLAFLVFLGGVAVMILITVFRGRNWLTTNLISSGCSGLSIWIFLCLSIPIAVGLRWTLRERPRVRRILREGGSVCEHCLYQLEADHIGRCPECGTVQDGRANRLRWASIIPFDRLRVPPR